MLPSLSSPIIAYLYFVKVFLKLVAEAIQTILRLENYPNPYEALKELTRGNNAITKTSMHEFINGLKISATLKKELKAVSPHNYTEVK